MMMMSVAAAKPVWYVRVADQNFLILKTLQQMTVDSSSSSSDDFVIESIRDRRMLADGTFEYLIKWEGYPVTDNSWEPTSCFTNDVAFQMAGKFDLIHEKGCKKHPLERQAARCRFCRLPARIRNNMNKRATAAWQGRVRPSRQSFEQVYGIDLDGYMGYLKSMFKPGMTMDNYGMWEIDHRRALRPRGVRLSDDELAQRLHYTNTRPMFHHRNNRKGNGWSSQSIPY